MVSNLVFHYECFFIIVHGNIIGIPSEASDLPRGGWFPNIITGLSENVRKRITEFNEKLEEAITLDDLYCSIVENIDIEFDDEDLIEMLDDEEDLDNLLLYKKLMRAVKMPAQSQILWDLGFLS